MSGLSRTPGKRVWVNSPPRVRIPPSPPVIKQERAFGRVFRFYPPIHPPTPCRIDLLGVDGCQAPLWVLGAGRPAYLGRD